MNCEVMLPFPFVISGKNAPHIAKIIFNMMDWATLIKCRSVCKVWRQSVDAETSFWSETPHEKLIEAARQDKRMEIWDLFIEFSRNKNPPDIHGNTPLHEAGREVTVNKLFERTIFLGIGDLRVVLEFHQQSSNMKFFSLHRKGVVLFTSLVLADNASLTRNSKIWKCQSVSCHHRERGRKEPEERWRLDTAT